LERGDEGAMGVTLRSSDQRIEAQNGTYNYNNGVNVGKMIKRPVYRGFQVPCLIKTSERCSASRPSDGSRIVSEVVVLGK